MATTGKINYSNNALPSVATNVTDWPLSYHEPLETWHRGKIVLIGDAAHPVSLPPVVSSL